MGGGGPFFGANIPISRLICLPLWGFDQYNSVCLSNKTKLGQIGPRVDHVITFCGSGARETLERADCLVIIGTRN